MNIETTPLQRDMFTGDLVDTRSAYRKQLDNERQQPHQQMLFPVRDIWSLSANARPWLNNAPKPNLELVQEDVRTPDEVEHNLLKEAEALTTPMFGEVPETVAQNDVPVELPIEVTDTSVTQETAPAPEIPSVPLSAYLAIAQAAQETVTTLWIDPVYQLRFHSQLARSILTARGAGLSDEEIVTATQIGVYLGRQQKTTQGISDNPKVLANNHAPYSPCPTQPPFTGYRRQSRRTQSHLHARQ